MYNIIEFKLKLYFKDGPKLTKKNLQNVYLDIQNTAASAIVVVEDGSTPMVKRAAANCNVEIFLDKELMFNVTKHEVSTRIIFAVQLTQRAVF